jgi:FkbM family methyltransferase
MLRGVVRRLPPAAATPLRAPARPSGAWSDRARLGLARVLQHGGIPDGERTFVLGDNPALRFVNADSLVLQQLYWFGEQGWEPELLPWWRYFCGTATRILELGANVGYYAVQGGRAAPTARYVAVEPHPVSVEVCRANLTLNGIETVDVVGAAAVPDPGTTSTQLLVSSDQLANPTVAFLAASSELPARMAPPPVTAIEVPTVAVGALLAGVDLLKLDVEGQEHELLQAGWEQLTSRRPTVFVEVLPGTPRLRALLARLCTDAGYRCYAPAPQGLVPLPPGRLGAVALQAAFGTNDVILSADPDVPTTSPRGPAARTG